MDEWRSASLAEVVMLQRGHDLPATTRGKGTVPVIGSFGITGYHDVARYRGPGVAIGRSGASIGVATYCAADYWPLNTCLFVKDFKGNDPRWVYYLLDSIDFSSYDSGSAQPSLNRNYLVTIEVHLPSIDEQRTIGATLGALDDKIESNRRAIDIAEALGDAIFTAVAATSAALSDVAQLTMGSSPPGTSYNEDGIGTPFYQGVRDFGRRYPGRRVWTTEPIRLAEPNDTLVSVRAPVGDLNRAYEICCVGRGVASVRSKSASTIYYALRAAGDLWEPFQQEGTVFGAINRADLAAARIPWPDVVELPLLEAKLSAIDARIESLSREISGLTALRDKLLPELLSGRILVQEAADAITDVLPEMENA